MVNRIMRLAPSVTLLTLSVVLVWILLVLAGSGPDCGARAGPMSTLDRDLEPVVITGTFLGASVDRLFVYRELGGILEQIPFQVDEVTTAGNYTDTEDGLMDSNDEIVFMAKDLGDKMTSAITATLPISSIWYEIEVTDPLDPAGKGWAYIVQSSALSYTSSVDYADYISSNQRINATNYAIGWAVDHAGLDYESLFGGGDILDRAKLRARYTFIITLYLTEDDLLAPPVNVIKDGPVRVIVGRGTATTFAYASFLRTVTVIDFTGFPGTLEATRFSIDLASTVTGTYYDENVSAGVTVDGNPEVVSAMLSKPWRQISLNDGTVVQIMDLGSLGGTRSHYYKDDSTFDGNDTGDGMSYGDSGIQILYPSSKSFTVESVQYILPGKQGNRGNEYCDLFESPLLTTVSLHGDFFHKIYLPLTLREH